jgi:hypothetical protein
MEKEFIKKYIDENFYFYLLLNIEELINEAEEDSDKMSTIRYYMSLFKKRDEITKEIYAKVLINIADENYTDTQIKDILFDITEDSM